MTETLNASSQTFGAAYIDDLSAGNADTMDHFVSYFRPRLRSLLQRNGARSGEVEDLQQETFLRVLIAIKSSKGIHHPEQFGGFVGAVCKNALRERFRCHKRYTELDDSVNAIPDESPDQHALLLGQELARTVRRIISRLSPRDQTLLRAAFWEQKTNAEICKEFGLSSGCARLVLHRAKRRFEKNMNGDERKQFRDFQRIWRERKGKFG